MTPPTLTQASGGRKPSYMNDKAWEYAQQCGWPLSAITDPSKFPKIVNSKEEFIRELMCGNHVEQVVILPNGLKEFGLDTSIEKPIQDCIDKSTSMMDFLKLLRQVPDIYKARFCYDHALTGRQKEVGAGDCKRPMFSKLDEIFSEDEKFPGVYVAELRRNEKYKHPATKNENVKTALTLDVKDVLPHNYQQWFPYWDRYDEGIFVGDNQSGKCLHVDQVLWSNIGKNFTGYKIAAAWPFGKVGNDVLDNLSREVFKKPIDSVQARALEKAAKVVVLQPGDLFFFSGGIPHTTLCISEELNVTCYESIVTPSPAHVALFLRSGICGKNAHHEDFAMPAEELKELLVDVQERLEDVVDNIEDEFDEQESDKGQESVRKCFHLSQEQFKCWEECFERFCADKKLSEVMKPTRKTFRELSKSERTGDFEPDYKYPFEMCVPKEDDDEEKNDKDDDDASSTRSLETASESDSNDSNRERFRRCTKSDSGASSSGRRSRSRSPRPVSKISSDCSTALPSAEASSISLV